MAPERSAAKKIYKNLKRFGEKGSPLLLAFLAARSSPALQHGDTKLVCKKKKKVPKIDHTDSCVYTPGSYSHHPQARGRDTSIPPTGVGPAPRRVSRPPGKLGGALGVNQSPWPPSLPPAADFGGREPSLGSLAARSRSGVPGAGPTPPAFISSSHFSVVSIEAP